MRSKHINVDDPNRNSSATWYLSGIEHELAWESYTPPPNYDVRNDEFLLGDDPVAVYSNRYDLWLMENAYINAFNLNRSNLTIN